MVSNQSWTTQSEGKNSMIICPWCGTQYPVFQPNCVNCGGTLQNISRKTGVAISVENIPTPPPAPRAIAGSYAWRLLFSDGWAIGAFVLGLLGLIFSAMGIVFTLLIVTAFIGIPFLLLGLPLLGAGGAVGWWRFRKMQKLVVVLREGSAARGEIVELLEVFSVTVNGRHPWVIRYRFQVNGRNQTGSVTTLNQPGDNLQVGNPVSVLYLPNSPQWNSLYPHP